MLSYVMKFPYNHTKKRKRCPVIYNEKMELDSNKCEVPRCFKQAFCVFCGFEVEIALHFEIFIVK